MDTDEHKCDQRLSVVIGVNRCASVAAIIASGSTYRRWPIHPVS